MLMSGERERERAAKLRFRSMRFLARMLSLEGKVRGWDWRCAYICAVCVIFFAAICDGVVFMFVLLCIRVGSPGTGYFFY